MFEQCYKYNVMYIRMLIGWLFFPLIVPEELLQEILPHFVKQHGISKSRKLGYYNAFVRFCYRFGTNCQTTLTKEQVISW